MSFSLAILCALEIEAEPIIRALKMDEKQPMFDQRLGLRFFASATAPEVGLVLFGNCPAYNVNRIGTQIASLAAWETIRAVAPRMIASVGTAGGFKSKGAQIGDVYLSDGPIYFHGRHIPVPEYRDFELGRFPSARINIDGRVKRGVVSSGDSIPPSTHDQEKMHFIKTDVKDMEAAAIAEVAYLAGVPVFALKSISDFVDSNAKTHEQFLVNYKIATQNLAASLELLITSQFLR